MQRVARAETEPHQLVVCDWGAALALTSGETRTRWSSAAIIQAQDARAARIGTARSKGLKEATSSENVRGSELRPRVGDGGTITSSRARTTAGSGLVSPPFIHSRTTVAPRGHDAAMTGGTGRSCGSPRGRDRSSGAEAGDPCEKGTNRREGRRSPSLYVMDRGGDRHRPIREGKETMVLIATGFRGGVPQSEGREFYGATCGDMAPRRSHDVRWWSSLPPRMMRERHGRRSERSW